MPRITAVEPSTATGRAKEIFEGPLKGKHFNLFKSMAANPAVLDFYLALGGAQEKFGLNAKEREAIQLAISEANSCGYCSAAHTAIGKMVGLSEGQTKAARAGTASGDAKLDALVHFAKTLHAKRGFIDDHDVAAFTKAGYKPEHMGEVIAVYATITFTNFFNHVNQTAVDFPAAPAL